jgi:hypothetical protein
VAVQLWHFDQVAKGLCAGGMLVATDALGCLLFVIASSLAIANIADEID